MNNKKKTVVSIAAIRPDLIRMSYIFKELDKHFNHILVHTGQHYDPLLNDVFFEEFKIRKPDYMLNTGKESTNHYEQLAYLSVHIIELFKRENIKPDLITFLGDSNSVCAAVPLRKEGYKVCHIEAGMRSYDKRMLEEINRTVCDHVSNILFVYHEHYKEQVAKENITENVFVVGNTIVEPCNKFKKEIMIVPKRKDMILLDIHRPENFNYSNRLRKIIELGNLCIDTYNLPVKVLYFKRLKDCLVKDNIDLGKIEMIPLMPYKKYLDTVYHSKFIISDSGTGQEEPALLDTPVVVPRDFTERPESYAHNCSIKYDVIKDNYKEIFEWINKIETNEIKIDSNWLGDGTTSKKIIEYMEQYFSTN